VRYGRGDGGRAGVGVPEQRGSIAFSCLEHGDDIGDAFIEGRHVRQAI
jgi:hypothetical protein